MIEAPDCRHCKHIRLWPENFFAWELIQKHRAGLIRRSFTGRLVYWEIDYAALGVIFRAHAIPRIEQPQMIDLITAWAGAAIEEEQKQHAKRHRP